MSQKNSSGFTKTGFTRSFSCCGHFDYCNMGTEDCYYCETDPNVQECCHAWVRNHHQKVIVAENTAKQESVINSKKKEFSQLSLSLFD